MRPAVGLLLFYKEKSEENENMKNYKIAVAGTGYVGLSLSVLLAQHNQVMAVDIVQAKVDMINNHKSPIQDDYIEKYLAEKELNLTATLDAKAAYSDADFVIIAAPTNYDSHTQHFDTSAVEAVIKLVMEYNPNAIMVIKSTIPVGYTASVRAKFNSKNIIFSPEFLRESKALYDNEAIVSREVFNAANHLRASRNYSKKNRPLPVLSVVEDGILRGYVPFDKDWTGFSAEEYREASESVMKEPDVTVTADVKKRLDLTGYEMDKSMLKSLHLPA